MKRERENDQCLVIGSSESVHISNNPSNLVKLNLIALKYTKSTMVPIPQFLVSVRVAIVKLN